MTSSVAWVLLVYANRPLLTRPVDVTIALPHDASPGDVADLLAEKGLVEKPLVFSIYLRLHGAEGRFREGPLVVTRGLAPSQLLRRIATGFGAADIRFTIPEGINMTGVAKRLASRGLAREDEALAAMRDPEALRHLGIPGPSMEGYLFPDTYEVTDDTPVAVILARMVENHRKRTERVRSRHADALETLARDLSFAWNDVVTLASIVEKEAAVDEERAVIAGVFLNRLRSTTFQPRRRLQADPTVSYGCVAEPSLAPSCGTFAGRITRAMLDDDANRYNTYKHSGLPPGPISNPGLRSLEAVLAPDTHRYLYFVARGNRRHTFSETLRGHAAAVDRSRANGVLP